MKAIILFFFAIFPIHASSCEIHPNEEKQCYAASSASKFFSGFPVLSDRAVWKWYQTERLQEYDWTTEFGTCHNGVFVSNNLAYSVRVGTLNLVNHHPTEGSLQQLLNESTKAAHMSIVPKNKYEEDKNDDLMTQSRVIATFVDGDIIVALSGASTLQIKKLYPSHVRMRAILPDSDESYVCITQIEKIDLSSEYPDSSK
ncbi:MAG: hypothetical protein LBU53_12515 [Zoogloeaceae bacterium]|jgi:hypothetical protein|nr:hypothetical protein [Zoogloeaceae bacterium]